MIRRLHGTLTGSREPRALLGPGEIGQNPGRHILRLRIWRRRLWLMVALAGVGLGAAVVVTRPVMPGPVDHQRADTGVRSGPAPPFTLPDLEKPSRSIALADYLGTPVVVNFWASWCVPCRREMPRLAAADRRLNGRVAFVGVNYQDNRSDAIAFARKAGVRYRSGFDSDGAVGTRYRIYGMPTTLFIDARGRIVARYLGEMNENTLDRFLRQLAS